METEKIVINCDENKIPFEPLMANKFLLRTIGTEIPDYAFRKFKIFNEGEELIFTTQFLETTCFIFNPKDFFLITGFIIDFLNLDNKIVKTLMFDIKASNFEKIGSYKSNKTFVYNIRSVIDINSMKLI
jgi:hypothetical protein